MTDTPLSIAASLYDISERSLQPIRGGHTSRVYGFTRAGQDYILRLIPPGVDIDISLQRSSLAWMAFLAAEGVCVSRPIPSVNGSLVETIDQMDGVWLAVVQSKASGILSEELPLKEWNAGLFEAVGRAVGSMHAASRRYFPAEALSRPDWDRCSNLFNQRQFNEPWLEEKAAQVRQKILGLPKDRQKYGLIHADLHFGNFIVDIPLKAVTIIDFDDICLGWYMMDLAVLLFDVLVLYEGSDRDAFASEFLGSLLRGYRQAYVIDQTLLEQLPVFMKLLEINIYARVAPVYRPGSDWWSDKFMPGRQERIENNIPYVTMDLNGLIAG